MNNPYGKKGGLGFGWGLTLGALALLGATPAMAANISVTSTADTMQAGPPCTLREAIISANTNPGNTANGCISGDAGSADLIQNANDSIFDVITLNGSQLPVLGDNPNSPLRIESFTIDAHNASRIFTNQGNTTLFGLTLSNGIAQGTTDNDNSGGAILNSTGGILSILASSFQNNSATRAGGAIEEDSGAAAGTMAVSIRNSRFTGNKAGNAPGKGGGNGGGTPPPLTNAGTVQGDIQFVAITLDAPTGGPDSDLVIGDGLPVRGPALTQVAVAQD